MKKKTAGLERPWTFREFQNLVEKIAKENEVEGFEILEYFDSSALQRDEEILSIEFDCISKTDFGGSEGIYSGFYFRENGEEKRFAVAKTLYNTDEAYIKMSLFAAKICLTVRKYVSEHEDEFTWKGFNVGYEKDGKEICVWYCGRIENAQRNANELKKSYGNAWIRDNSTRKYSHI